MQQRIKLMPNTNGAVEGMVATETWLKANFDERLLGLVKTRASQINGCAYCLHMHSEEARKHGESEARLLLLSAWEESAMFTERERAALAWTEALTKISETHAPDDVYNEARRMFSEDELIKLSIAIAMINAWNRLSIGFRAQHPADRKLAA